MGNDELVESQILNLSGEVQAAVIGAARDTTRVSGLTHEFYKYPARFSPIFARAVIQAFTKPGDSVLDPHVGGGTTLVEARASGREAVGIDISTLAEFVSSVKCTVFSERELGVLEQWSRRIASAIDIHKPSRSITIHATLGYYKHLDHPSRWRLRKAIEQSLASAIALKKPRLVAFGRCVILRASQWALDGRKKHATVLEFRKTLEETGCSMVQGARELRAAVKDKGRFPITILRRNACGIETDEKLFEKRPPRLVVTSPPYPGVHVLYHRWQVDGRKEAPLPFMIANKLDGAGSSYYTMGDRKYPGLATYFANIQATMRSVAALSDHKTMIVQMLAFTEVDWQLSRFLETMNEVGLTECFLSSLKNEGDGRLWRNVPGRRWYSDQRGSTPGSKEVVLFHRKLSTTQSPPRDRQHVRCPRGLPGPASSTTT